MAIKTPVRLRHHFQYNAWKYILLVVLSVFFVDLIYTMTAYRPPQDKRIDVYIQSAGADQNHIDAIFEQMREELLPDMELIRSALLMAGTGEDIYAVQQMTTYLAAGEGDIYLLKSDDFKRYASQGVFVDLSEAIQQGQLHTHSIDLSAGYVAVQEFDEQEDKMVSISQKRLYGIPLSGFAQLAEEFGIYPEDLFMSMTVFNGNDENVIKFMDELIARTAPLNKQEDAVSEL